MADNSGRSKENPFSFKNFLRNSSDGDTSPSRQKKKGNGSEDSDNPFSFRKFLNQGKSPEVRYPQSHTVNTNGDSSNEDENFASTLPPRTSASPTVAEYDFSSQELPDFIQDHLEQLTESKTKEDQSLNIQQRSADDTCCSEDFHNFSPSSSNHLATSFGSFNDSFVVKNDEANPGVKNKSRLPDETIYSIPDFISSTQHSDSILPCSFEEESSKTSLDEEVHALREENTLLQRQLQETTEISEHQLSRIAELEDKLNELTDKETQETAALEKMVQQVEHNLQMTTERAIKAEAQVSKLKQEMKLLQAQLKTVAKENERLNLSCSLVERDVVAAKADSIALQIKTAADNAEQPLRTMIEGLENLRFLSALVADIGKIEEAK